MTEPSARRREPAPGPVKRARSARSDNAPLPPLDHLFEARFGRRAGVALAVSGGSDSMALLALAAEWTRARAAPPRLHVLTVDHGLRDAARAEAETVRATAAMLDIPCDILTWSDEKPATGLQAKARAARYRLLVERARALGLDALATAHTRDDQAETLLMRLARGSGPRGLAGMAPETTRLGFPLVRPFLDVSRADLRHALAARGIGYVDDPSNGDPRYERVRWRAMLPVLATEGLTAAQLAHVAARCRRADDALEALARDISARATPTPEGRLTLDRAEFRRAPLELQIRVLDHLIESLAAASNGDPLAAPRYLVSDDKRVALALALAGEGFVRRTLGGVEATARGDTIAFRRENPRRFVK